MAERVLDPVYGDMGDGDAVERERGGALFLVGSVEGTY